MDPCCGGGHLLEEAAVELRRRGVNVVLLGADIDRVALGRACAAISGSAISDSAAISGSAAALGRRGGEDTREAPRAAVCVYV